MAFLDTRFPEAISYGSQGGPKYSTSLTTTGSGYEKRNANWSTPRHVYNVVNGVKSQSDLEDLLNFFHSVRGMAYAFRYKDWADYKSCKTGLTPTFTDQAIGTGDGTTAIFQIVKVYQEGSFATTRTILKPVSATVSCAIASVETSATVSYTSGLVTFPNKNVTNITTITQASTAVVSAVAHTLTVGDSAYFSAVVGMVEINGTRGKVLSKTANSYTVDINTLGYTAYASGGVAHTLPQPGETVYAGYEFDVPCRFASDEMPVSLDDYNIGSMTIPVMEVRNA